MDLSYTEFHSAVDGEVFGKPAPVDFQENQRIWKQRTRNVDINSVKPVPWLSEAQPPNPLKAILVGSGTSVDFNLIKKQLWETRTAQIFAVGTQAARNLHTVGIIPDGIILTNPDTWNLPRANAYYIAAHCDPKTFDLPNVTGFHTAVQGENYYMPNGKGMIGGGGVTAGLNAMVVVYTLGYRDLEIHGYDSDDPNGDVPVEIEGEHFKSTHQLVAQTKNFPSLACFLMEHGVKVSIHGTGFLPFLLKKMQRPVDEPPHLAYYDLAHNSVNWDFFTWLVGKELKRRRSGTKEPLRVRFANDTWDHLDPISARMRAQMLYNVMKPSLKFFGAIEDDTIESRSTEVNAYKTLSDAALVGEKVPLIEVPDIKLNVSGTKESRIVITIREATYSLARNSRVEDWLEFGRRRRKEGYNVIFVRDTNKADLPLEDFETCPAASRDVLVRAALYNACKCNLCLSNGPAALLLHGRAPFIYFIPLGIYGTYPPSTLQWWTHSAGFTPPDKFPWLGEGQNVEWRLDTLENIEAAWERRSK